MVLGGKVLVVDVDFSVDRADPFNPNIDVANVKTSYAIPNSASGSTSTTDGSISLDAFLAGSIRGFCAAVQKDEEERDPREAARLGILILEQLRYLVMLDRLAARNDDGGIRWFVDIDLLCSTVENFARSEAQAVAECVLLCQLDQISKRFHDLQILIPHPCPAGYLPPSLPHASISLSDVPFHLLPSILVPAFLSLTSSYLNVPSKPHEPPPARHTPLTPSNTSLFPSKGSDHCHALPIDTLWCTALFPVHVYAYLHCAAHISPCTEGF